MPARPFLSAAIVLVLIGSAAHAQQDGLKRTPLQRLEFPRDYVTQTMLVELAPNATVPRHVHPGIETGYIVEGEGILMVDGRPDQRLRPGDSYEIPANVPHSVRNAGDKPHKAIATFVVDKDKPLASPAP
jgi:quercetin dioxygenase-like cupin family protein